MLDAVSSSLNIVKLELTTPNMSQLVATRWRNARNMLRPTMLRYVELAFCDRLVGALGRVAFFISSYVVIQLLILHMALRTFCHNFFN